MALPESFLEELRGRFPVSAIAARYVRLQRRGREYVGLSPFNRERTPSFTVNDDKGFFHCFSSGRHGDQFSLLMALENLSFREAVEQLAAEAGMTVPQPSPEEQQRQQRRGTLLEAVEAACRWFEAQLRSDGPGADALAYLRRRGVDDATIAQFRLGYAPADGQALRRHLLAEGFDDERLVEAGLLKEGRGGAYSFFRDRVLFPVADRRGRVVAFGGRLLHGDGPKYLNTGDSPLFQKSELLYGLALARQHSGAEQPVVAVEGYTDVIALHRAGYRAAVAPLGTALTEAQLAQLWRLDRRPYLCFDGDDAGRRAAWRAVERALPQLQPDHSLNIAFLPAGQDPDTLVQAEGAPGFAPILAQAIPLPTLLWRHCVQGRRLDNPDDRAGLEAALEQLIGRIPDRSLHYHYRQIFRDWLRESGRAATRPRRGRAGGKPPQTGESRDAQHRIADPAERRRPQIRKRLRVLVASLLVHPHLFDGYGEALASLETGGDAQLESLIEALSAILSDQPDLDADALSRHLESRELGDSARALLAAARQVEGHALAPDDDRPARRLWESALALRQRERTPQESLAQVEPTLDPAREEAILAALRAASESGGDAEPE